MAGPSEITATAPPRAAWLSYGGAAAFIALALLANRIVHAAVSDTMPNLLFPTAVVLSTLVGGFGAGLVATALAALVSRFVFTPPTFAVSVTDPGALWQAA